MVSDRYSKNDAGRVLLLGEEDVVVISETTEKENEEDGQPCSLDHMLRVFVEKRVYLRD